MRRQFIRFAIAGGIGFIVDAGVLYLILPLGCGPYWGRLVSFLCAAFSTWQLNRRLTFEPIQGKSAWREWHEYLLAMAFGGACNYVTYVLALQALPPARWSPIAAIAAGSLAGMIINFASAKLWVFRR
ncbi:GtrA family protein [Paraburkholderia sacchari]|uniref:GtrA family protein n=1 Tax=Paraburkholderia sacchari TaxID=159450 RepID=UPI003D95441D